MPLTSDTFPCGHERTPENSARSAGSKGAYTICATCRRGRDKARKANPEQRARNAELKRIARAKREGREVPVAKKNKALATDHLKLPLRAVKAESELHLAMEENRAKCEGQEAEWADYGEDNIPNRSVARAMCEGCPLMRECSIFADKSSPAWGIWGGKVYVDGKAV